MDLKKRFMETGDFYPTPTYLMPIVKEGIPHYPSKTWGVPHIEVYDETYLDDFSIVVSMGKGSDIDNREKSSYVHFYTLSWRFFVFMDGRCSRLVNVIRKTIEDEYKVQFLGDAILVRSPIQKREEIYRDIRQAILYPDVIMEIMEKIEKGNYGKERTPYIYQDIQRVPLFKLKIFPYHRREEGTDIFTSYYIDNVSLNLVKEVDYPDVKEALYESSFRFRVKLVQCEVFTQRGFVSRIKITQYEVF